MLRSGCARPPDRRGYARVRTPCNQKAADDEPDPSHPDSRRRHRPRDRRCDAGRARRFARPVRLGSPDRRPRRRPSGRRPAAESDARQHPPYAPRAEGPVGNAVGRRLPLVERAAARGVQALRQSSPRAHGDPRRPLRQDRPGGRARKSRRALHRPRALRADRRRPACRRDGDRHQHPRRQPAATRVRIRDRGCDRPQKSHDRAQGQHHEGADRHLPGDRPGAVREAVPGQVRARHRDHRPAR